MLSRSSNSRLLATFVFGLLLFYPDLLSAQYGISHHPAIHPGPLVSMESGAEGQRIEVYQHQLFTLEFDKPIRSISGYDPALLLPTPGEPNKIKFKAQGQRGETTLHIKDESDTVTNVAVTIKSKTVEKLRTTLQELFPDATLELVELNDAILIRGHISTQLDLIRINEVAGQYYPEVLNHSVLNVKPGSTGITRLPPMTLDPEIARVDPRPGKPIPPQVDENDLQSDIRALHADVKRLIELLEQRQSSTGRGVPWQGEKGRAIRGKEEFYAPAVPFFPGRDKRRDTADTRPARGTFSGVVRVDGEVPKLPPVADADHARNVTDEPIPDDSLVVGGNNGLANVFVYLPKPPPGAETGDPGIGERVNLMSRDGRLVPHCAIVHTGQKVQLQNFDPVASNFHIFPARNNPVNIVVAPKDRSGGTFAYERPESLPIKIGDDICPWKRAYHLVVDHPFAAVTDEEGRFQIEGLPPGNYTFTLWHERVGYIDKDHPVSIVKEGSTHSYVTVNVATLLDQRHPSTKTDPRQAQGSPPSPPAPKKLSPAVAVSPPPPKKVKPASAAQQADDKPNLPEGRYGIFFYADWMPQSLELWKLVRDVARHEVVKVHGLDVGREEYQKLARQLGVTELPTLLLVDDRKEVRRKVDMSTEDDLRGLIRRIQPPHYETVWIALGIRLRPQSPADGQDTGPDSNREGMLIIEIREEHPQVAESGLREGDVLVGLGISKATNIEDVYNALVEDSRTDSGKSWIHFHADRDGEPLQGQLQIDESRGPIDKAEAGTVLLFFQANWCIPCQQMVPVIRQIDEEGIVRVRTVDVDKERVLAEKYDISSIPSMVLLRDGKEVHRWTGTVTAEQVREFILGDAKSVFKFHVGFTR